MPDGADSHLDHSSSTIARELALMVRGDVRYDPISLSMYSCDASMYEIEPLIVVNPIDEEDVRTCVTFAYKNALPIIARGAGTGLGGEALGRAIIMDMNVYMARIIELDRQNETVVVESGVVLDSLNRALRPYGFRIGPNPGSSPCCTIGGMIATNAHGPRSLAFGNTRDNLVSARMVLADGTVTNFRPVILNSPAHERKQKEKGLAGAINRTLPELIQKDQNEANASTNSKFDRCGFNLKGVVDGETFDPSLLIPGSEGTLGIVTEAVLKVQRLPEASSLSLVYFKTLSDAAKSVPTILETKPVSCELLDQHLIDAARIIDPENQEFFPEKTGALLAVEYEAVTNAILSERLKVLEERMEKVSHISINGNLDADQRYYFKCARKSALSALFHRPDGLQPTEIVEGLAVAPDRLAELIEKVGLIFTKYGLAFTAHGPIGLGTPHLRPLLDLREKDYVNALDALVDEIHEVTKACNGSMASGHAGGLIRASFIEKQVGSESYETLKKIKKTFDPTNILNPDKVITDNPDLLTKNLKYGTSYQFKDGRIPARHSIALNQSQNRKMMKSQTAVTNEQTVEAIVAHTNDLKARNKPILNWIEGELEAVCYKTNGYMLSRATGNEPENAPRFKYNRVEDANPQAWIHVIRRLLNGRQEKGTFTSKEMFDLLEYCGNSHRFADHGPTAPNISKLIMEAKARYHESHGIPSDVKFLINAESYCNLGSLLIPLANTFNDLPIFRFLLEKVTGLDRRRPIPHFKAWRIRHSNSFDPQSPRPKVVLYADMYAKYFAPELVQAAVDILEHNGHEVVIPKAPCVNTTAMASGAVIDARKQIRSIAEALAPYANKGYPILVMEPSDALALSQECLYFLDTPETRAVARHTQDIGSFLFGLLKKGTLKTDFQTLDVRFGYHQPSHHMALRIGKPGLELVKRIPGVKIAFEYLGTSGMMTMFGMLKRNYDESMWLGRELFKGLANQSVRYGLTDSTYCRMQMEHGSGKPALHPLQVLSAAYGFGPAKAQEFAYEPMDQKERPAHQNPQPSVSTRKTVALR